MFVTGRENWVRDWGECVYERERTLSERRLGL